MTDNGEEIYTYNWSEGNDKKEGEEIFAQLIAVSNENICLFGETRKKECLVA